MIDRSKLIKWYDFQAPFYSLWRDRYDSPLVAHVVRVAGSDDAPADADVLDAATGTGVFAIGMARARPDWNVRGLDASSGMLAVAGKQAGRHGLQRIEFRQGDVTELPYPDDAFDLITAGGLIPCLNEPPQALREFRRVLRAGGRFISVEFDRGSMNLAWRLFFHGLMLGFKAIAWLRPDFRYARRWNIERSTIDPPRYEEQLDQAGFRTLSKTRQSGHLVYEMRLEKD